MSKQFCLFRLFQYRFETPKQTEIFSFWFQETNRNKCETDLVSVCFGYNRNLFLFVLRTPLVAYTWVIKENMGKLQWVVCKKVLKTEVFDAVLRGDKKREEYQAFQRPNPKKNMVYGTLRRGDDYNLTLCPLQSRLQHIYRGQPYARVDHNPMPESALSPSQGLWILPQLSCDEWWFHPSPPPPRPPALPKEGRGRGRSGGHCCWDQIRRQQKRVDFFHLYIPCTQYKCSIIENV